MTAQSGTCATGSSARTTPPSPPPIPPSAPGRTPNFHLTRKRSPAALEWRPLGQSLRHEHGLLRRLPALPALDRRPGVRPRDLARLPAPSRLGAAPLPPHVQRSRRRALPLYEAYAVIWASDNLQYNGGGATHSSAYNLFAFRSAANLARLLGEDPAPYEREAALIAEGIERLLWLPAQGAYAESKDLLGAQAVYNNPAMWTVYHAIDSEVPTPRQAWQALAERLSVLRRIPVHGPGVPAGGYMLSCSDWLPYIWSLNLLALAENVHTALAMWQAGMAEEAFLLLKGNLLDSLFMGLAPGNFHMTSALDAHRQEAQRDSGDPIGITARALTEGLFGIQPNLIANSIRIRPGFPSNWDHAILHHKDFDFSWQRLSEASSTGADWRDIYDFSSQLNKSVPLTLIIPAPFTIHPTVLCNGPPSSAPSTPLPSARRD